MFKSILGGWDMLILFFVAASAIYFYMFLPRDIRGQADYRPFNIAAMGGSAGRQLVFCHFDRGAAHAVQLDRLQCMPENSKISTLVMPLSAGRLPYDKDDPDDWNAYKVIPGEVNAQMIETETYYNSDSLVTRYRVTGNMVEPLSQLWITRGMRQMFVLIYLPLVFVAARALIALARFAIRKNSFGKDEVPVD